MNDRDLTKMLAGLVAPFDHDPNGWDDVLRRARTPSLVAAPARRAGVRRTRWTSQRWPLRAAVAALAAGALIATPPGRAGAEWLGEQVGIGGPPSHHEFVIPGERKESYVLAAGHDPDGRRYEFVLDRYPNGAKIADGERVDACLTVDWIGSANPGGAQFCGPGFPPFQEGGRAPGDAAARPFGYLSLYPQGTRYLTLSASPSDGSTGSRSRTRPPAARAGTPRLTWSSRPTSCCAALAPTRTSTCSSPSYRSRRGPARRRKRTRSRCRPTTRPARSSQASGTRT